jgi:uncharacterized membrane protein HdeD (DUF308 family)
VAGGARIRCCCGGASIFLDLLLVVAGAAAIASPVLSTFAVELWAAIAFAIAGIAQTIHAFAARSWSGFFWGLLVGLLYLAAGIVLWLTPIAGVVTLTVFLAAVLVVDGVFRSILAFQIRPLPGWFWLLLGGLISIVLGVMIWQQLPSSALSVLACSWGLTSCSRASRSLCSRCRAPPPRVRRHRATEAGRGPVAGQC